MNIYWSYCSKWKYKANDVKVESIENVPIPTTKKKINSFIGMIGFYDNYFATIALPLTDLMSKRTSDKINWTRNLDPRVER